MRDGYFDIGTIDGSFTYYDNKGTIIKPIEENKLHFENG